MSPDGFLNQATMQASNDGVLLFTGSGSGIFNNTGGTIQEVGLAPSAVHQQRIPHRRNPDHIEWRRHSREDCQNAFISDLTNAGTFVVNDNSFLHISGTITNSGSFSLNSPETAPTFC